MVPSNSSLVGGFAYICQSHLVIKKSTNSLFKRPSRCGRVVLKSLIIRAYANAVISSWLRHYTGRHENHTGYGFCSHTVIIIIIFHIYTAQINVQQDMIKCALHIKIEYEITMLPIYTFEFTIKCEDVYCMKH